LLGSDVVFEEHTCVALKRAVPRLGLLPGALGVVIHVYPDLKAYEVEFLREDGTTLGVETIKTDDLQLSARTPPSVRSTVKDSQDPLGNPAYPLDDGPKSAEYIATLRADAREHMPIGRLIDRKELFESSGDGPGANQPLVDDD
jgi:hypothetical protein